MLIWDLGVAKRRKRGIMLWWFRESREGTAKKTGMGSLVEYDILRYLWEHSRKQPKMTTEWVGQYDMLDGKLLKGSQKKGVMNQPCHLSHKITVKFSKMLLNFFIQNVFGILIFYDSKANSGLFNKNLWSTIICSGLKQNKFSALCIALLGNLRLKIVRIVWLQFWFSLENVQFEGLL